MKLGPDELLKTVYAMRSDMRNKYPINNMDRKYNDFKQEYPHLYTMIIENSEHCIDIVKKMVHSLKLIDEGTRTREEMDKIVGEELAKTFIYEKLDMTKEEPPIPDPVFVDLDDSENEDDKIFSDQD